MTGQTEGNTQTEQLDTALICLSIVAGHHGIDVRPERLAHDYATENGPVSRNRFLRIAKDLGLKVKAVRMGWEKLLDLGQGYPVLAPLTNGNMVVVSGVREAAGDNEPERLAVIDPLAGKRGFIYLSREQFSKQWSGEVILLKRVYSLGDENQPFGLRWFIPEILRQRKLFTDIIVAAIFLHFIGLVTPIFFQVVIDKVIVHESYSTLNVLGIGIVVALLFDAILEWLRSFLLLHASSKIDVRVATRTFAHLNSLPLAFFERATAGTLTKHMQQTDAIRQFMTGSLLMTMLDASALLVFLPALFFYSPLLTGVVLGITALIALIILAILPVFRIRLHALYQAEGERQSMLVESLQGMRTVKALSLEPVQRREWDDKAAAAVSMRYRVGKVSNIARTASKFLEKLMSVAIVWVGALAVFDGGLTIGALVAFNMLAGRVSGPLVQMVGLVHEYQETALSVRMLGTVMNQAPEGNRGRAGMRPEFNQGISFERVSFRYSPEQTAALDEVGFEIPAGSTVGLVGRSGSGKSTLARLLQGMHMPQTGVIRFDGVDLRELDLAHLRQRMGVVLQDNFLFRGTVRDNIRMPRTHADMDAVHRAAEMAGATGFIERLPQSYDTLLEENASNLSGGQKQRLAIARALITDPPILILDEATSALDPESEAIVQRNLELIARGRTVLMISHRLSLLTSVDNILVLDEGRLIAQGTHQKLLEHCDLYQELWRQQMKVGDAA